MLRVRVPPELAVASFNHAQTPTKTAEMHLRLRSRAGSERFRWVRRARLRELRQAVVVAKPG